MKIRIALCGALASSLALALLVGCQDGSPTAAPPTPVAPSDYRGRGAGAPARRTAAAAPRAASDGGGRAWIEEGPDSVVASSSGAWRFGFEVGPEGIAEGGLIVFMVSPFWGWSPPQDRLATAPGHAGAETDAEGVTLTTETNGSPMMGVAVGGRRLQAGERVYISYGGAPGARTDQFAESRSRFWIGVDGDGDGTYRFLADSPFVRVDAGPAARMLAIAPSTVRVGADFTVRIAFLDRSGNAGTSFTGELSLASEPAGLEVPGSVAVTVSDNGLAAPLVRAPAEGVFRVVVAADGLTAASNPIVVTAAQAPQIFWGDLHGHSSLSDGTGTARDYFLYARDVAALDVVSLTDHDHWGVLHLDENPSLWNEIQEQSAAFHQPGRFVTLPGYEWTSWEYGHRHVLFFAGEPELYSSLDLRFNEPTELWDALRGRAAITVAHHSAGGPIATDWSIPPDPVLEPITEVVSVHGVSEAADAPSLIYDAVPGNFVRDALGRGYRFGFVGSGDSHDGHPGLAQIARGGTGGLAAIIADELTRPAILEAIRQRRVYATSGPRIYLRAALATFPMGSVVERGELVGGDEPAALYVHAIGTDTIRWLDFVRSGEMSRREVNGLEIETAIPLPDPQPGDYVYVRIVQGDGGIAWSSPIYVE